MQDLRFLTNADVAERLSYPQLIEALRIGLAGACEAPVRGCHELPGNASLLTMPVWRPGQDIGVKLVTVFPGNGAKNLPAVGALFCLFDGETGRPLAMLEASEMTARRTACTSALAADYLVRRDARRLLVVGSGTLAPHMVRAHSSVREYEDIAVWGRQEDKVDDTVWAVTCLFTRAGCRRRGVGKALARAAVGFARDRGARALEAYPITTKDAIDEELHVGTEATFAEAGLTEVSRPTKRRAVMRIDF